MAWFWKAGHGRFALLSLNASTPVFASVMTLDFFAQAFAGWHWSPTCPVSPAWAIRDPVRHAVVHPRPAGQVSQRFSGVGVEALTPAYRIAGAYATAFVVTGLTAIPPLLLLLVLWRVQRRQP